jgi:hypothetical protein
VSVAAFGAAALLLSAWSGQEPTPSPPTCSAEDTRRSAILTSGTGSQGGPLYLRFCGRGRLIIRASGRAWILRSGNCIESRGPAGNVSFGLVTNDPAPPGRGVMFWWYLPRNRSRPVTVQEWAVELPGFPSVAVPGGGPLSGLPTVIAKGPRAGTFSVRGSQPRVTGSWTCSRVRRG